MVVSNILTETFVEIVTPELMKEFYVQENNFIYKKQKTIMAPLSRMAGDSGIVFLEGHAWKKKRKVLNKMFNFELVKALSESIAKICEEIIINYEK